MSDAETLYVVKRAAVRKYFARTNTLLIGFYAPIGLYTATLARFKLPAIKVLVPRAEATLRVAIPETLENVIVEGRSVVVSKYSVTKLGHLRCVVAYDRSMPRRSGDTDYQDWLARRRRWGRYIGKTFEFEVTP